ncbi:expressed unknown protein [Seminavis robusta]|uniref:Uncharacterized protein n=1 Tax=Seminavis robusta TaxID=568900 RepID=A0A9N8D6W5_9STRA|nr:expressed unknown protein [Seminavis robusta]|eukprot:Sro16_g011650.1 n/a (427) ;mRNA; f:61401-62681
MEEVKVVCRGMAVEFVKDAPTIASFSVAQNWDEQKTSSLRAAIQSVLSANPILTSCLETRKADNGQHEMVAMFHTFNLDELFKIIPNSSSNLPAEEKPLNDMDQQELLAYLDQKIIPQFPSHVGQQTRLGGEEVKDKSPVFEVQMMELPGQYVCYTVLLSHCIGDGAIYYQVMEQLNSAFTSSSGTIETKAINWDGYDKMDMPTVGPHLVPHPLTILGLFVIGPKVFKKFGPKEAEPYILLLSKKKINQKKIELVDHDNDSTTTTTTTREYLTSNDIVVSALCEAMLDDATVHTQAVNMRYKLDDLEPNDAGSYVLMSTLGAKEAAGNPNVVHKVNASGQSNMSPWKSFLSLSRGKVVCNTSWTGLKCVLDGTVAHFPSKGFLRTRFRSNGSSYATVIFEYDDEALGILATCPWKKGGLLESILLD